MNYRPCYYSGMPKKGIEYPHALGLRLDAETWRKLEAMAKAELRPIAAMGRIVLVEGLALRDAKGASKGKRKA